MPEQKLLPPAKEGRIYYDHNELVKSQQLLRLYDELESVMDAFRYYKQRVEGVQYSIKYHHLKETKMFVWRTLSQHENYHLNLKI